MQAANKFRYTWKLSIWIFFFFLFSFYSRILSVLTTLIWFSRSWASILDWLCFILVFHLLLVLIYSRDISSHISIFHWPQSAKVQNFIFCILNCSDPHMSFLSPQSFYLPDNCTYGFYNCKYWKYLKNLKSALSQDLYSLTASFFSCHVFLVTWKISNMGIRTRKLGVWNFSDSRLCYIFPETTQHLACS